MTQAITITITQEQTNAYIHQLCQATGMTPSCLVALLVRKYGQDLLQWLGEVPPEVSPTSPALEFPSDPGEHLEPIEL